MTTHAKQEYLSLLRARYQLCRRRKEKQAIINEAVRNLQTDQVKEALRSQYHSLNPAELQRNLKHKLATIQALIR